MVYGARLQVDLRSQHCERKMGSLQAATNARESGEHATRKHRDSPKRRKVTPGFDAAIRVLCGSPVTQKALLDLFDNRAGAAVIRAWRYGWNAPPQWAADLLKTKLRARAAATLQLQTLIIPRRGYWGWRGKETLAAWRERKAHEKEKAASEAALQYETKNSV